jgi:hypothetical protein
MTADPRAALDRLIAALEAHFDAVANRRSEDDPRIDDTYDLLADAFEVYDGSLADTYNELLPFAIDDSDDDDDDIDDIPVHGTAAAHDDDDLDDDDLDDIVDDDVVVVDLR